MPKNNIVFVCRDCGHEYMRWQGKCDICGAWNTLEEFKVTAATANNSTLAQGSSLIQPSKLSDVAVTNDNRIITGINEIDRVFGGGFVPGSLVLLSGEPGIGKSTLLLQIIGHLSQNHKVLYWSAEESVSQVAKRAQRLKLNPKNIEIVSTIDAGVISSGTEASIVVVDSIQTIADLSLPAPAGSVTQVRSVLQSIQIWAKENNKLIIVVGHVTKDGVVAGPKTLEHLVDVVTVLEGDPNHDIRLLRGTKNRFGPTNEIGVFSMDKNGLQAIDNPSKLFLEERLSGVPGSIVTVTLEGSRPLLVEIQALVTKSYLSFPRRTSSGIDSKRLDLIIAILENRTGIKLYTQDIFVNVVGGIKVTEPAVDLAIALSIVSALLNITIPQDWCVFGEIGLAGELRKVKGFEARVKESKRLGYKTIDNIKTISQAIAKLKSL
jgi:DNA repair protein RadA/Sms